MIYIEIKNAVLFLFAIEVIYYRLPNKSKVHASRERLLTLLFGNLGFMENPNLNM